MRQLDPEEWSRRRKEYDQSRIEPDQYVLITFYNRGRESAPIWEVYGHRRAHWNDCVGSFSTAAAAMKKAFEFRLPVMHHFDDGRIPAIVEALFKLKQESEK